MPKPQSIFSSRTQPFANIAWSPISLFVLTAVSAAFYAMMEWVFIFTRPSFLRSIPFMEKTGAFASLAGLLILASTFLLAVILLPGLVIKNSVLRKTLLAVGYLLPTFFITSLALLMLDNFTYTVLHFGIVSTSGFTRGLYAALILAGFTFIYFKLTAFHELLASFFSRRKPAKRALIISTMLVLAVIGAVLPADGATNSLQGTDQHRPAANKSRPPDILLITVDGVNAQYTSLDGQKNDTTPFLRSIYPESLRAINAFSNAQGTIGSLTAILTGRHPVDTRVIYSSDMLQGADSFKHLPGILRKYGYYTAQLSNAVYADAYRINFQNAFDEANGRSVELNPIMFWLSHVYPGIEHIFHQEVVERISDRLGHIFFINDMSNPYDQVTTAAVKFDDRQKLNRIYDLFQQARQPLFIHMHWMGTHGPVYQPEEQVFSAGFDPDQQDANKQLFYFDSVLEFDRAVEEIYTYLEDHGRLENTILIITSDHTQKWTNARVPLFIRFPKQKHAGIISQNVQTLDIAPTLLNYLGMQIPDWMAGRSLLSPSLVKQPIFTAKIPKSSRDMLTNQVIYPDSEPPFYQFGRISVIACNQWFELDLQQMTLTEGVVADRQAPCATKIDDTEALKLLIHHLQSYGFDTSSLDVLNRGLRNR